MILNFKTTICSLLILRSLDRKNYGIIVIGGYMKKLLLILICLLFFVGCEKEEEIILKDGRTVLMNVMNSEQEFIDEYGNKVLFKDF